MWEKELHVAGLAARKAGGILNRLFGQVNHVKKKGAIDLVTEADMKAEKSILEAIGSHFPDDNILSEESGRNGKASDRTWMVDPLDGTTNFVHGFPFFAVSIALEIKGKIVLGIVYNPFMDEYFEAARGGGAYLNNRTIKVSKVNKLEEALLGTGFPYYVHESPQMAMENFRRMLVAAQGLRRPGAAAIDLCYLAAGRLDGFWEEGLKPWDTAAGVVIAEEAGGRVSTYDGRPYSPYEKTILAANPHLHGAMLKVLNKP
jgi:myo-inositol-1(or 4)-monophosphatase